MNDAPQERTRGQDDRQAVEQRSVGQRHPRNPAPFEPEVRSLAFDQPEPPHVSQRALYGAAVQAAVHLGTRALRRRPLAAVQQAKLNPRLVTGARHYPVERVNLPDDVALTQTTDRRIARHLADAVEPLGNQRRAGAAAPSCGGSLRASMAATDDDDVPPMFHVKQSLFA